MSEWPDILYEECRVASMAIMLELQSAVLIMWSYYPECRRLVASMKGMLISWPSYSLAFSWHSCFTHGAKADRKSTRLNSSHQIISYAVFCLKKKKTMIRLVRMQ